MLLTLGVKALPHTHSEGCTSEQPCHASPWKTPSIPSLLLRLTHSYHYFFFYIFRLRLLFADCKFILLCPCLSCLLSPYLKRILYANILCRLGKKHFFVNSEFLGVQNLAWGKCVNYNKFEIASKQCKSNI